jgi:hypothetical protein
VEDHEDEDYERVQHGPPNVVPLSPLGEWNAVLDAGKPPPRGWLLGNTFCRGFPSSLYGDGAVGKTALRYAQAISLATNRSLTGEHVFQRCRVLIVSLEDDADELRRRILAVRIHYNIELSELDGWLFLAAPGGKAGKLMQMDQRGRLIPGPLRESLERAIRAHNISLVILDPFVKAHSVDENSNTAIDDVVQILSDMAAEYKIAVDVPHHVAKGIAEPGNAQKGRGASALTNAVRLAYTLTAMNPDEAATFNVPEMERRQYVRLDRAKLNCARISGPTKWFKLIGVSLDNATALYPSGDEVQTVEAWLPPGMWDGLNADTLQAMLNKIDSGLGNGSLYTVASKAKDRAAWLAVQAVAPQVTEGQARAMLKSWIKTGHLAEYEYYDPNVRKPRQGLRKGPNAHGAVMAQ